MPRLPTPQMLLSQAWSRELQSPCLFLPLQTEQLGLGRVARHPGRPQAVLESSPWNLRLSLPLSWLVNCRTSELEETCREAEAQRGNCPSPHREVVAGLGPRHSPPSCFVCKLVAQLVGAQASTGRWGGWMCVVEGALYSFRLVCSSHLPDSTCLF